MDRRQRKTRQAIFAALIELLAQKDFEHITVAQIIERADIGRATFYAHFETKEFLLKALCDELFCHLFDAANPQRVQHHHIFDCDAPDAVFLHLLRHLQSNDNGILTLLSCRNNELFLRYFKTGLRRVVESNLALFAAERDPRLPDDFWIDHICSCFVETVRWWIAHGLQASAETVNEYFYLSV